MVDIPLRSSPPPGVADASPGDRARGMRYVRTEATDDRVRRQDGMDKKAAEGRVLRFVGFTGVVKVRSIGLIMG